MQSCVFFCALLSRRFWLGFGIGGDYPLSATIMSEYANKKTRGAFIAAVFAMQGFGILGGATVSIVVSAAFRNAFDTPIFTVDPVGSTPPQADYVWRIIFMLGALPAACTFYYRMKMPETARYTALVAHNNKRAALDMGRVLQVDFTNINESNTLTTTSEQLLLLLLLLLHHTSNSRILWLTRACALSLLIKFHTLL
jgi:PHS family inorganic phosphate transporter-like MFS transporter